MPTDYKSNKIKKSVFPYRITEDKLVIDKKDKKEVYQLVKIDGSEIILKILYDYPIEVE